MQTEIAPKITKTALKSHQNRIKNATKLGFQCVPPGDCPGTRRGPTQNKPHGGPLGPEWPPQMVQGGPKRVSFSNLKHLQASLEPPGASLQPPGNSQSLSKTTPRGPKTAQDAPKTPQDAPKTRFWWIWGTKSEASWHQNRNLKRFYVKIA